MMVIKVIPITIWAVHGTGIRVRDIVAALARPLTASLVGAAVALGMHAFYSPTLIPALRLALDIGVFGTTYIAMLVLIAGEKALYLDLFRAVRAAPSA